MNSSMDWNQELQDLTEELLTTAFVLHLYQFAVHQNAPALAQFPRTAASALMQRCSDQLQQRAADLQIYRLSLSEHGEWL